MTANTKAPTPGADVVCIDTETTGLDPKDARVVEIAALTVRDGKIGARWSGRINPGPEALEQMSEEALEVHGLDSETLADEPEFETRWNEFEQWLEEHASTLEPIAHNAVFDAGMIAAELKRIDRGDHPWNDPQAWVDTWKLSREEFGDDGGSHGLDGLAKRLGVRQRTQGSKHTAGGDTDLLAKCWIAWGAPKAIDLFAALDAPSAGTNERIVPAQPWKEEPDAARQWCAFWEETFGTPETQSE